MMELKVVCNCGQKYKFDVEPVNGQMPFVVNCPVCGIDGTNLANGLLSQMPMPAGVAVAPPPIPIAATPPPPPRAAPPQRPVPPTVTRAPATPKYLQDNPALQNNNFLLGTVGAILGAVVAVGFMVGAHIFLGYTFSYFAVVMGAIIGFGARLLYRGTSSTLGAMSALIAFVTIAATLFLIDGLIGILFDVLYLLVGTAAAFKIAS